MSNNSVRSGAEDPLDELLDALEFVRINQPDDVLTLEPIMGDFFCFGKFTKRGRIDSGELGEHGGEGAVAAVAQVIIARKRDLGLAQIVEDLDDDWESGHGPVDCFRRLFARSCVGGGFNFGGHDW